MPVQRIDNLGAVGLNADVLPTLLPPAALTVARNVATEDAGLRSITGERRVFESDTKLAVRPLYHRSWVDPDQDQWVIISDGVDVYAYRLKDDGVSEKITPTDDDLPTGNPVPWTSGFVSFAILNGVLVINSRTDGLFYWEGTGNVLKKAPGWDDTWRCFQIAAYRYQLVALGMIEGASIFEHKIRWSTSAQEGSIPSVWDILLSNDAGDDLLGETEGAIVGGVNVRDQLYIVKEDAIYAMRWIGGQYINQTTRLEGGVGTRNPKGFCEMRGNLVIMTTNDCYLFDGQNSISIMDKRVRSQVQKMVSEENWDNAQVFYNPYTSRLFLGYPTSDAVRFLNVALMLNVEENTFSVYDLKNGYGFDLGYAEYVEGPLPVWDDLAALGANWVGGGTWDEQVDGSWNKGIINPSLPDTLMYESTDDDTEWWLVVRGGDTNSDNSAKNCSVGRTGIPIEGAHGLAQLNWVYPEMSSVGQEIPVIFRFGGQETADGAIIWDPTNYVFQPGQDDVLDPRVTGRYLAWEMTSFGVGGWRLGGLTLEWEHAGRH